MGLPFPGLRPGVFPLVSYNSGSNSLPHSTAFLLGFCRLVQVPEVRGKADLSKYRDAGREVIEALLPFRAVVERASVDEAYLDLTQLVVKRKSQARLYFCANFLCPK